MRLSDAVKMLASTSARSLLSKGIYTAAQIVQKIADKFGIDLFRYRLALHAIVTQQRDAATAAVALSQLPTSIMSGQSLSIDWTLAQSNQTYGYTVRATYTSGQSGESADTLIVVTTDSPMSAQEVLDRAQQEADRVVSSAVTTNPDILNLIQPTIRLEIISAGRRP